MTTVEGGPPPLGLWKNPAYTYGQQYWVTCVRRSTRKYAARATGERFEVYEWNVFGFEVKP